MHCWQIIHLTQKINFLPHEQYIRFQTIFVLRQENFHKRIFLLPIMDHFPACTSHNAGVHVYAQVPHRTNIK